MKKYLVLLAIVGSVHAQSPLPEELAVTRSVVLQNAGEVQATAGMLFFKGEEEKRLKLVGEFEYGLLGRWELDAEVPYVFLKPADGSACNGLGDVEVALRYGVVPISTHQPFALTAGLGVVTPSGDRSRDIGEGRVWLEPFFTVSDWLGPVNVQLNAGWAHAVSNGSPEPTDEFEYNIAVLYPLRDIFLVLEGNGESNHSQTNYHITPEVVWRPRKNLEINVAVPIGVSGRSNDYGIFVSATFEIGD